MDGNAQSIEPDPLRSPRTNAARILPAEVAQAIPSPAEFPGWPRLKILPRRPVSWLQSMDQHVGGQIDGVFAGSGKSRGLMSW